MFRKDFGIQIGNLLRLTKTLLTYFGQKTRVQYPNLKNQRLIIKKVDALFQLVTSVESAVIYQLSCELDLDLLLVLVDFIYQRLIISQFTFKIL